MILIRHGQSTWNAIFGESRTDPHLPDPELTELGHQQIAEAAESLKNMDIRHIIVSPYFRTLQSASIINDVLDVPMTIDPRVRERNAFSCDIGRHPDELKPLFPHLDFSHVAPEWYGAPVETFDQLDERRRSFEQDWRHHEAMPHILVVCHWGYIRSATGTEVTNGSWLRHIPT